MSRYDYLEAQKLSNAPFYALIMAAMKRADFHNQKLLASAFPEVDEELRARRNAPGGVLKWEREK